MFRRIIDKIMGSSNDRELRRLTSIVEEINNREKDFKSRSEQEIKGYSDVLRSRLSSGESMDDILIDSFANVREAARRSLGERHFDVQLIGGIVLHNGQIAEMKTGEGKTLVSTLAVYLNALSGKGVHVVTVNDYLAKRDAEWMGKIYHKLGLSVGCVLSDLSPLERIKAYNCDVTYGTNNEFGFDYLRDNIGFSDKRTQRDFNYAIIDEVDSILIDEARTPLIISGAIDKSSDLYLKVDKIIKRLSDDDYDKDLKLKTVHLNEQGIEKVEEMLRKQSLLKGTSLYGVQNVSLVHYVNQGLRANTLFERDVDYIVKDGNIVIIDEFTGRMMSGRRYSEGLHQALEAREGLRINFENQTLASITFQNYFRLYPKIAGMTGTALTEAEEFASIYGLRVLEIPTHKALIRKDLDDKVYCSLEDKLNSIIDLIEDCHKRGQPVLVGTTSIEKSEEISLALSRQSIRHKVLNARYHDKEALIIGQAGKSGAITIATNMAGRGTDIKLGGNEDMILSLLDDEAEIERVRQEVLEDRKRVISAGGLFVIGTERHEARRIDNQLRGRSGRQGDPGSSVFFLSLEDNLLRIFGSEKISSMLNKLGASEGDSITHPWVNKSIERAQRRVEGHNFEIRKNLLRFDDVMNDQRKIVYEQRRKILSDDDIFSIVEGFAEEVLSSIMKQRVPTNSLPEQWQIEALKADIFALTSISLPVLEWVSEEKIDEETLASRIESRVNSLITGKYSLYGSEPMEQVCKHILLRSLDQLWKEHLLALDHLRQGINLRAYGQRDPLNEYRSEAFATFDDMLTRLSRQVVSLVCHIEVSRDEAIPDDNSLGAEKVKASHPSFSSSLSKSSSEDKGEKSSNLNRGQRRALRSVKRKKLRAGRV